MICKFLNVSSSGKILLRAFRTRLKLDGVLVMLLLVLNELVKLLLIFKRCMLKFIFFVLLKIFFVN